MASIGYTSFPQISFEEYLEKCARNDEKLEFLHGVVYAMAGGSREHSWICGKLITALNNGLKGKSCYVLTSDTMVETPNQEASFYADVSVFCGPKLGVGSVSVSSPILVIEVLSRSTRNYDLSQKLQQYQRIAALRHILYVDSAGVGIQLYSRGDGELWPASPTTLDQREDLVSLEALELSFRLDEVYGDLEFPAA